MGDICAVDYPINVAGNSHGRCITYGYLLGTSWPARKIPSAPRERSRGASRRRDGSCMRPSAPWD